MYKALSVYHTGRKVEEVKPTLGPMVCGAVMLAVQPG